MRCTLLSQIQKCRNARLLAVADFNVAAAVAANHRACCICTVNTVLYNGRQTGEKKNDRVRDN